MTDQYVGHTLKYVVRTGQCPRSGLSSAYVGRTIHVRCTYAVCGLRRLLSSIIVGLLDLFRLVLRPTYCNRTLLGLKAMLGVLGPYWALEAL